MPKTPAKEPAWKRYVNIVKDVVFVVGILVSAGGWIRSETIKKNDTKNKIEALTKAVDESTEQLKKINTILMEQQTLNGKIIQYMSMK